MLSEYMEYITYIIVGDGVDDSEIPQELSRVKKEKVDEKQFDAFIKELLKLQKNERLLVITHQYTIVSLVDGLNQNLHMNKISVLCDGNFYTKELEMELEKMLLHSEDGTLFFPESIEKLDGVYHAGERILLKRSAVSSDEIILYNSDNKPWGVLLNEKNKFNNICGKLSENINQMSISDKAEFLLNMTSDSDFVYKLSDIVILKDSSGNSRKLFFVIPESKKTKKIDEAEFELFTGLSINNDEIGRVCEKIAEMKLPAVLIEDLNDIIINKTLSRNISVSRELIRNTMKRIVLKESGGKS